MIISRYKDVILREFEETDIPKKVEWINNPANNQYLHYDLPLEIDKTVSWFRNKDNSRRVDCVIEYNGIPVGLIGLLQIDRINKKAEYYITIGETDFKHKGIATKATKAILEYAFVDLKLHKVYLTVDAKNENAIRLYEKAGFKQEGYFVGDLFRTRDNGYIDRERYAIISNSSVCVGGVKLYFEITSSEFNASLPSTESCPTSIQRIGRIQHNEVFIKRDDLLPFSFGGNKARKAELFFKEIDAGDYDCVVTYGSSSSNHCRVVSNLCAARGLECSIISPQEASEQTFNSKLMNLFGAKITTVSVEEVHDTIEQTLQTLRLAGHHPYFIPGGGHGNLGTQAYVDCYEEIRDYEAENNIHFDYIFHASGTGTTQAGLICGQLMHKDEQKIIGISIARKKPRGRDIVLESVREYCAEKMIPAAEAEIQEKTVFIDDFVGDGYGKDNEAVLTTIWNVMKQYGVPLDSTYTGKAFWGMRQYIAQQQISGKNILFIHTGGTPLFFDDLKDL